MDGFRDRLGRGASDRGMREDRFDRSDRLDRSDRFDEGRFDRGSRRSSYGSQQMGSMSEPSVSVDEIARVIEDSNANQLNIISDMNEDTKDFIYSANQKVQESIEMALKSAGSSSGDSEKLDAIKKTLDSVAESISNPAPVQVVNDQSQDNGVQDEILRTVRDNSDLLTQFAEEQVSMLIRGNSSMLSQISESLEEKGELIRELIAKSNSDAQQINPVMPLPDTGANEEVLQTVVNNNTLLNALRAEVAGIQSEMRDSAMKAQADAENGPLDATPVTKEEIDLLYRDMEEHVHKECVKVYKNVQAALEAQNASVGESVKKGTGGLKFLIIFNLILTVVNILLAVAGALNILA